MRYRPVPIFPSSQFMYTCNYSNANLNKQFIENSKISIIHIICRQSTNINVVVNASTKKIKLEELRD